MSIVAKLKDFWFGAEESYDGFDELFSLQPPPQPLGPKNNREQDKNSASPETKVKELAKNKPAGTATMQAPNLKVLPAPVTQEVVVFEPKKFGDAANVITDYLKKGSSVVMNLHLLDASQAQRLVDFICGGICALGGTQQRVGDGVFLLMPNCTNCVNVSPEKDKENKLSFWPNKHE